VLFSDWNFKNMDRLPILGIPTGPYLASASAEALSHFEKMKLILSKSGYEIRSIPIMDDYAVIRHQHDQVLSAEAARVHAAWYGKYQKLYAQKTAELIEGGRKISEADLQNARLGCSQLKNNLREAMEKHAVDLWIAPSAPGTAPKGLENTGDPIMNLPWTQAGLPALNLPAGTGTADLPMGLQLIGSWHGDEALLYWAEAIGKVIAQS
jgi:Asp-tRNA(Asn)/Glu-tRNA(Gln) amidotransferase A subunit family amidase